MNTPSVVDYWKGELITDGYCRVNGSDVSWTISSVKYGSTPNITEEDIWTKRYGIFVVRDVDQTHVYPYGTERSYVITPNSFLHVNGLPNSQRYVNTIQENGSQAFNWWSERMYGSTPWLNQSKIYYIQSHILASGLGSYDHINWYWGVYTPRCISISESEARFNFIEMTGISRDRGPGNIIPNGSCYS